MKYVWLVATLAVCIQAAQGQSTIAYFRGPVSSVPEFPACGDSDLNMDGEPDLRFAFGWTICTADVPTSACMTPFYMSGLSSNQITVSGGNVALFPAGTLIGATGATNGSWGTPGGSAFLTALFWNYDRFTETYSPRWSDPLASQPDSYLGIRFNAADGVHYCWIHVSQQGQDAPLFVDWAYETRPDTAIHAGAKPATVPQAVPEVVRFGQLRLKWQSEVGKAYQVQVKESLNGLLWTNLDFVVVGTATIAAVDIPIAGTVKFFRVVEAD